MCLLFIARPASFLTTTEPRRPLTPTQQDPKQKADDPPADIGLKPLSASQAPPPPYVDRDEARRAKLLDNAAREARERKQAREGSAVSRPGTGTQPIIPAKPPTPPSPDPKDSDRAKLLDGPTPGRSDDGMSSPRRQATATPQGLAGMSINDILKMKMAQKADGKKKPRKIIST